MIIYFQKTKLLVEKSATNLSSDEDNKEDELTQLTVEQSDSCEIVYYIIVIIVKTVK